MTDCPCHPGHEFYTIIMKSINYRIDFLKFITITLTFFSRQFPTCIFLRWRPIHNVSNPHCWIFKTQVYNQLFRLIFFGGIYQTILSCQVRECFVFEFFPVIFDRFCVSGVQVIIVK